MLASEFQNVVETHGVAHALRLLNSRSPYRYSAVFAFQGTVLRNLYLVDKLDSSVSACADQPITASYCIYVHESEEPVAIDDADADRRTVEHPKRRQFRSYYGIPLWAADGGLLGTACHFDEDPIAVNAETSCLGLSVAAVSSV